MKDTIKAKTGYIVRQYSKTGNVYLFDGDNPIMKVELASENDYKDNKEWNECFKFCEKFTTKKGNEYLYWQDTETGIDYLTKINKVTV